VRRGEVVRGTRHDGGFNVELADVSAQMPSLAGAIAAGLSAAVTIVRSLMPGIGL
jgi:hypothetical protein